MPILDRTKESWNEDVKQDKIDTFRERKITQA